MSLGFYIGVVIGVASIGVLWLKMNRMFAAERARSHSPFHEELLRPPGESLRLKIDQIRDEMLDVAFFVGAALVVPSVAFATTSNKSWTFYVIFCSVVGAAGYGTAFRQWRRFKT